jgi:hypothetical protein
MMKPRLGAWRAELRGISTMTVSYIVAAPQASFNDAFPLKMVRHYSSIFMREFVAITLCRGAWFFLADNCKRCDLDREVLYGMPVLCGTNPRSGPRTLDHPHYMVVGHVGPGSFGYRITNITIYNIFTE